jgi:hypothetical protein
MGGVCNFLTKSKFGGLEEFLGVWFGFWFNEVSNYDLRIQLFPST